MKKFINVFASAIILFGSVSSTYAMNGDPGTPYYFRYKTHTSSWPIDGGNPDDGESKSITAFYVSGLDVPFSERLPLRPEWEDDNWVVSDGSPPEGISFDPATLTFEGTPEKLGT